MNDTPAAAPAFPPESSSLLLAGPAGAIELACALPIAAPPRRGIAIIAHPHPLQGGTMHNKVVTITERALLELGLATVRFNFRGVGRSEGVHDEGHGETDDLVAIAQWLRAQRPGDALWLAGFSFGSYVTLRAAARLDAAQLVLIAPPVGRWDFSMVGEATCPWLIVQGEDDEVVDARAVFAWAQGLQPPPQLIRMPETGHFFHRRLMDLRGALKNALAANLPPARA
ncbi:MAG: alpha/beta hydrolase [Dokdonella sp.]|uniref:alpha/beta hydrolase n=1 Tax=Dokdonella sp. TaxID=2291710 RepID=UPI003F7E3EF6